MPLSPEVKYMNNQLIKEFGLYLNRPQFRIVWTGDLYEKRLATYTDWMGSVKIREVTEVREVPKYPYINPPWYMLERAVEVPQDESIKNPDFYEPLYIFQHFDEKGNRGEYLPPRLDMACLAANVSLMKVPKRTHKMDKGEFEEKEAKGEQDIYEQIREDSNDLALSIRWKEASFINDPGGVLPTSPNLRGDSE